MKKRRLIRINICGDINMVWNDILIAVIYIVLAFVFAGVGYSILPKEFKNFIKKVLKIGYEKVIKNEKEKKRL